MNPLTRTWKTLLPLVLLGASACGTSERWRRPSEETLEQRYTAALASTRTPRPSAISRELTALTPSTPGLVWKDGKLLMGTWTELRYFSETWRGNHGNAEPLKNFPWTALGYTY